MTTISILENQSTKVSYKDTLKSIKDSLIINNDSIVICTELEFYIDSDFNTYIYKYNWDLILKPEDYDHLLELINIIKTDILYKSKANLEHKKYSYIFVEIDNQAYYLEIRDQIKSIFYNILKLNEAHRVASELYFNAN